MAGPNYPCPPALVATLVLAAGCLAEPAAEFAVDTRTRAQITFNGYQFDAYKFNALSTNGGLVSVLATTPLDDLVQYPGVRRQLRDPFAERFFEYFVGCALDGTQSLAVTWSDGLTPPTRTFDGEQGLCPEWYDDPGAAGDEVCHELVSACILARNNALGEEVPLSLRGVHRDGETALAVEPSEQDAFQVREGAFYGDMFTAGDLNPQLHVVVQEQTVYYRYRPNAEYPFIDIPVYSIRPDPLPFDERLVLRQQAHDGFMSQYAYQGVVYQGMYACAGPGWGHGQAEENGRLCAVAGGHEHCAAHYVGPCEAVCTSLDGPPIDGDGDIHDCADNDDDRRWLHPITVYLST